MNDKKSLQNSNKDCFEKYDEATRCHIGTDCETAACEDCGIYRQMYIFA